MEPCKIEIRLKWKRYIKRKGYVVVYIGWEHHRGVCDTIYERTNIVQEAPIYIIRRNIQSSHDQNTIERLVGLRQLGHIRQLTRFCQQAVATAYVH